MSPHSAQSRLFPPPPGSGWLLYWKIKKKDGSHPPYFARFIHENLAAEELDLRGVGVRGSMWREREKHKLIQLSQFFCRLIIFFCAVSLICRRYWAHALISNVVPENYECDSTNLFMTYDVRGFMLYKEGLGQEIFSSSYRSIHQPPARLEGFTTNSALADRDASAVMMTDMVSFARSRSIHRY